MEEKYTRFIEKEYKSLLNEYLFKVEKYFQKNKEELKEEFKKSFKKAVSGILELQKSGGIEEEIGYMTFTMLRTNIVNKNYEYVIKVHDKNWYYGKEPINVGVYDSSPIFSFYTELWEKLLRESRKYIGEIKGYQVESLMLQEADKFNKYVAKIGRYSILECMEEEEYKQINKSEIFSIHIGEYKDTVQIVYEERKTKIEDNEKVGELLYEEEEHYFEDYRDTYIYTINLEEMDLSYADLRGADLIQVYIEYSRFIGIKFNNCNFMGCDISNSEIYEADFENATLDGVRITNCSGNIDVLEEDREWERPGYLGVNFKNATLKDVNFSGSKLNGANFLGAKFEGINFKNTELVGAMIDKKEMNNPKLRKLDEEQKSQIKWV